MNQSGPYEFSAYITKRYGLAQDNPANIFYDAVAVVDGNVHVSHAAPLVRPWDGPLINAAPEKSLCKIVIVAGDATLQHVQESIPSEPCP